MGVQSIVLQVNGHATWDMMRWVVLCQKYAPMEVYALSQPCKHEEGFSHHNNDPKINKIPILFLNESIANGFVKRKFLIMIAYFLTLFLNYLLSSFLILLNCYDVFMFVLLYKFDLQSNSPYFMNI